MANSSEIVLAIGSIEVDTWSEYDVTIDMMAPGQAFTFSIWRSDSRGSTWDLLRENIRVGQRVQFFIDGALQLNGMVEDFDTRVDKDRGALMIVQGRDLAGWAMDCDADPALRLRGLPLDDALTALFAPLGYDLRIADAASARAASLRDAPMPRRSVAHRRRPTAQARRRPVDLAHPRPGEKVWGLAETMCRRQGFMLWTAPDGESKCSVVVDAPAFDSPQEFIFSRLTQEDGTERGNILSSSERFSLRNVPSIVNVYSGTARGDVVSARQRVTILNGALSAPNVTRGFVSTRLTELPRHIRSQVSRTNAQAEGEAQRVIADGMAHFRTYECTVQGHTLARVSDERRKVLSVNTMAQVIDDVTINPESIGINEAMLITRVTFRGGTRSSGQTTTVHLIPKDSIVLTPVED